MQRLVLAAALVVSASCSSSAPAAPTDLRAGFSQSVEQVTAPGEPTLALDSAIEAGEVVDPAAAAKTFTVTGVVTDKAYTAWKISTATVTAGSAKASTNAQGLYTLRVSAGSYTIR